MAKKMTGSEALKYAARVWGSLGGKTRAKRLSPEERQEIARRAALARWRKRGG